MSRKGRAFERVFTEVTADIFVLCRWLNFSPTDQQADLFRAVMEEHFLGAYDQTDPDWRGRLAVSSGQGPGKTRAGTVIMMWRTIQMRNAKGVVTAPTMRQCEQWVEDFKLLLNDAHPMIRSWFTCYKRKIVILGEDTWEIVCATATKAENIQGSHRHNQTIQLDEASGIERPIWEAVKGTVSDYNPMIIGTGNPNSRDSEFFDCFHRGRDEWRLFRWDARDSPRVSRANIAKLAREYGEDSNMFRIRVMGLFPRADPDAVFALEDLEACTRNSMAKCARLFRLIGPRRSISYDFARMGGDENVAMSRSGLALTSMWMRAHCEPIECVRKGWAMQRRFGWRDDEVLHCADANGIGDGLMWKFHEAGKDVFEFKAQRRAYSVRAFANADTEAWFQMRKRVRARSIYLPDDPQLIKQLAGRRYSVARDGRVIVEAKEDFKDRRRKESPDAGGGWSPDRADAAVMLFYDPQAGGDVDMVALARDGGERESIYR